MEPVTMTKRFIIEMNIINGEVSYDNPDDLNYFEVMGMIEIAKMMMTENFIKDE